ncbi:prephenate dehydrogenase [Furfurilactobacillus siliginis]|uniref:Prephenate dehydrogenase n=1 Tax=Furfurilactobacillus siliginis TaxID=348151 RepID=A0A0R2L2H7_9LACO|nr:prephenate dehydrogenase [Furfurilactobacillus siliginis]KRN95761.1 prephenate dehydrogenase [Furfurilactobacillus siliginis]GEK28963.1 prephenate dehydrogenase [Furfurilactobacillus siliginis]
MTTILIRGLGLIGSSLARAIRLQDATAHIIGSDTDDTLTYALAQHIIDEKSVGLTAASRADIIILATPVSVIKTDLAALAMIQLNENVVVTDVGSTKRAVLEAAQPLLAKGVTFIGGHPMAGSHKSGVRAGRPDLFENAFYLLVPGRNDDESVKRMQTLLRATHVKWLVVDADEHDRMVGQLSHVPHVIAAALVNETNVQFADSPMALRLAAGGFKSITRIASSDPDMWTAIMTTNGDVITQQLDAYQHNLATIETAIVNKDVDTIRTFFANAKETRDALGSEQAGNLPGFFDLFLNIPDRVGALADVTRILSEHGVNLVNIHILEVREEIDGVLQLTFATETARQMAIELLQGSFEIVRRS